MELLRFVAVGSVDDGKSTLIGRLLYDSKSILRDQWEALEHDSARRGWKEPNLALLTDGLRAEREQGITIDVAYRYFATARRRFIVADTPGHEQYTRNMVTGASTANLALILVDVRNGVLEQTRRHAVLASLLGIRHIVVCVNKMDAIGFAEQPFEAVRSDLEDFASRLETVDLTFIPVSALEGDNVVERSSRMSWYGGPTLLHHLEHVHVAGDRNLIDARLPVQCVLRGEHGKRLYAGTVAGGVIRSGDRVLVLPSGRQSVLRSVEGPTGPVGEAFPPMPVAVEFEDELDVERGDLICRRDNRPGVEAHLDAMVCWMSEEKPLKERDALLVKHLTRAVRARVQRIHYRLDVNTLHRDTAAAELRLNDIGRVALHCNPPLPYDAYGRNRQTGGFILVDEATNATVASGMISGRAYAAVAGY